MAGMKMFRRSRSTSRDLGASVANVLRTVAGAAMGHSRTRRGSAIVLSVSALVLLSVLTLVYWGIGRSDAHTAVTLRRATGVDTTVGHFADYIADVIARDKTSWYAEQPGSGNIPPVVYRAAWDFPWVDPIRVSIPDDVSSSQFDRDRFDPAGSMPVSWDPDNTGFDIQPFTASDPWLAPHKPMYLDMTEEMLAFEWMRNARDWWSISNFAPDGRFINLYNLRNNFAAKSGFTNKANSYAGSKNDPSRAMSDYLSLINNQGEAFANDQKPNVPAHWTMRQRNLFRPTVDVHYGADDPRHAFYQYADTDGDGFFDARWFELVDASVDNRLVSLLPQDDSFRWFFASRAVDLSGLVNVNTATDLRGGKSAGSTPTQGDDIYRIGTTPADIDLLRILMMQDSSVQNVENSGPAEGGYKNLVQVDPLTFNSQLTWDYTGYTMQVAGEVATEAVAARDLYFDNRVMPPAGSVTATKHSAQGRFNAYTRDASGVIPGQAMVEVMQTPGNWNTRSTTLFAMPSMVELLTYRGTNDDANTSPLERALGGRHADVLKRSFSPLRDNRPLFLERLHSELAIAQNPNTGKAGTQSMFWSGMDVRQLLTAYSGANDIRSSRLRFEENPTDPIRSFQNIVSTIGETYWIDPSDPDQTLANVEGRINAVDALELATEGGDNASAGMLFEAYVEALMPHVRDMRGDWTTSADDDDKRRTLFYGHNPFRALLTAAHMTANAIDMYDNDGSNTPSRFTVLFDKDERTAIDGDKINYPHWQDSNRRLDLGNNLLPDSMPSAQAPVAINVFGIEAQPFLIEASMFIMYSDAGFENGAGGDDDGGIMSTPGPGNEPEPLMEEVTIDGKILDDNSDFIAEIIAFEVTNPFDEDIELWTTDSQYYVEFAGHIYPLGSVDRSLAKLRKEDLPALTDLPLKAHETRVYYASAHNLDEVDIRIEKLKATKDSTRIANWITEQFGTDAVYVGRYGTDDSSARLDLLAGSNGASSEENRSLALWRSVGDFWELDDDLMADRLREPDGSNESNGVLDRRMEHKEGTFTIPGTTADLRGTLITNAEGLQDKIAKNLRPADDRNTGLSIVLSGTIYRPDSGDNEKPANGEFPAWCIERKFGQSLNFNEVIGGDPKTLAYGNFNDTAGVLGTAEIGDENIDKMFDEHRSSRLLKTLTEEPWWDEIGTIGGPAGSYGDVQAELHLDNNRFRGVASGSNVPGQPDKDGRVMRVADMLLPMGIGPTHMPNAPTGSAIGEDDRWTTLGESMALAIGYDTLSASSPGELAMLANMTHIFDKGHLRLDTINQPGTANAFVPFYDSSDPSNGEWDPGETRGAGIPIAYNVLDVFTTDDVRYGSMRRPRIGVVNVNTAPLDVLRTVPMFTPPPAIDSSLRWWWTGGSNAPDDKTDVAASLYAYIHKAIVPSISSIADVETADFMTPAEPGDPLYVGNPFSTARSDKNAFEGGRETPGLRSRGELLAVRSGTGSDRKQDMDYLAHDSRPTDMKGIESILFNDQSTYDGLSDDYDEKLAVINAAMGTTSVRSDYFAVWFVVHGYQRDDVEGLRPSSSSRPADRLTPTVAKRFVMVVDRTNVQRLGDKPRILMIQEVPM